MWCHHLYRREQYGICQMDLRTGRPQDSQQRLLGKWQAGLRPTLKVKDGFEFPGVELSCPYAFSKLTSRQGPTLRRHSGNRIHIKQDRDSGAQEKRSDEVGKMKAQEMSLMRLYISLYFMETEENSY